MSDLDSILNGEDLEEGVATQEPEAAEPEAAPTQEQPKEQEPTTGEEEAAPPAAENAPEQVPVSALLDERRKRQEERQRSDALQRELDKMREEPAQRPDVLEDQEGYAKSVKDEVVRELDRREEARINEIANESEAKYRKDVGDETFEATYLKFEQLAETNPQLLDKARHAVDPYKVVFDAVKKSDRLAKLENVDDIEARIRAEVTETIRAEQAELLKAEIQKTSAITPSLASTPGSGSVGASTWTGPQPLSEVFGES